MKKATESEPPPKNKIKTENSGMGESTGFVIGIRKVRP